MTKNKQTFHPKDSNANALAKLKRLKIQESVLSSSINKSLSTILPDDENFTKFKSMKEFKSYESSINDTFIDIKNVLEDVKIATLTHKNEKLDINEVKRDVLQLEKKIRSFKIFLQSEKQVLKNRAYEIESELTINRRKKPVMKKLTKPSAKQFTAIVPSPVRVLINSPFKCPEVQKFQEFVQSSRKRYEGWNEYNHNIFVQIWNKHFLSDIDVETLKLDDCGENNERFHKLREEVLGKIPGSTSEDITSHFKWYSEFVYLRNRQQKALEKWKENKQKMKNTIQDPNAKRDLQLNRLSASSFTCINNTLTEKQSTCKDIFPHLTNSESIKLRESNERPGSSKTGIRSNKLKDRGTANALSNISKPTEQWKNRCLRQNDPQSQFFTTTVEKGQLRIPSWRLGLQRNGIATIKDQNEKITNTPK